MDKPDARDKLDTYRWVSFLMDTTVLTGGADTKKALIFLSEVIATVYIIRGTGPADEFVMELATTIHKEVCKYIEAKETHFAHHATTRMENNAKAVALAKLAKLAVDALLPSSVEVKRDSMLPIFAGVYISIHSKKKYPMVMALCLCISYVLASVENSKDINDLSVLVMDSITDKIFQKTVKHLVEFESNFSERGLF